MKVCEFHNSILPKLLKVEAITLFPCIFYAPQEPSRTLRTHEFVHIRQMLKVGVVRWYIAYFKDYLRNLFTTGSHEIAYFTIKYESEAYRLQHDPELLTQIQTEIA